MKLLLLFNLLLIQVAIFGQEETPPVETPSAETAVETATPTDENTLSPEETELASWRETIEYGVSDQRLAIVKKIRSGKRTNGIELLETSFINENNSSIKEEIIYVFIDMKHKDNTQFWTDLFTTETNLSVLQRAAYAVELLEIPVGVDVFNTLKIQMMEPKAMRFNAAAVQALGKLKNMEALPTILDMATNITNHQDLRGSSVVALGMYQDDTMIPILQGLLTNTGETRLIRRYAALAIGHTENPQAIEILTPIAINELEEQTVRLNSISGLGYANSQEIIPTLENLTKSDNTAVRTEAIKSLAKLKAVSSRPILEYKSKNDPESIVRREAKNALKILDEAEGIGEFAEEEIEEETEEEILTTN